MSRARSGKDPMTIALMASSIILLVVLQVLWLRNSYTNAFFDLRRESNSLFRVTVMNMWDSVASVNIKAIPFDSLIEDKMLSLRHDSAVAIATIENNMVRKGKRDSSTLKVIVSTRDSTAGDILKPLSRKIKPDDFRDRNKRQTFIIRVGSDTLETAKLKTRLSQAFVSNGITTDFSLRRAPGERLDVEDHLLPVQRGLLLRKRRIEPDQEFTPSNKMLLEPVGLSPLVEYVVVLDNIRPLLFRRISAEIFFSVVLTTLTATAFVLMYRNIRNQRRLVEVKNEFINNVTHELKTPVATVSVALEALQNFSASENPKLTKEYLEIASRELKRLNEITDRILKTSVLEQDVVSTAEVTDLDPLIRTVIDDMQMILNQKQAQIRYESEGENLSLQCGSYELYQIMQNLIDNAVKYSGTAPEIEVKLTGTDKHILLSVKDSGIGIAKEYHGKIFDKFFRVPSGDIHNTKGYGLGLSYVLNLVRSVGGEISLDSVPGKGTTFTLKFPRIGSTKSRKK